MVAGVVEVVPVGGQGQTAAETCDRRPRARTRRGFLRRRRRADVQIVGVFEPDATLLRSYAERYNLIETARFTDLATMIDRVNPEAIAAFTNTRDHPALVETAAQRHIHVMMEKPLAVSNADAERIRSAAEAGGSTCS